MGIKTDTFQKHHDRLLRDIPDTSKRDNYGASDSAKTCSITKQTKKIGDPCLYNWRLNLFGLVQFIYRTSADI